MTRPLGHSGHVDDNQAELVAGVRAVGAHAQSLASVGHGCPDLLVGHRGVLYLVEIKNPHRPPNKRQLSPEEKAWHEQALRLGGITVHVVETLPQLLAVIGVQGKVGP